jgi:GTPase SAR1 family protein
MKQANFKPRQILLCGLDYSGKTTLIKQHIHQTLVKDGVDELVMTTPFINVEQFNFPSTNEPCILYDMSG